ncbi:MAG: SEC-C domain-containing protein [Chloroflexi bacterium]|nr:SEC-C domain-containing protein [Chloroflexota bacterium]
MAKGKSLEINLKGDKTMSYHYSLKQAPKPDDPCPCGSGKPYKDCCGKGK